MSIRENGTAIAPLERPFRITHHFPSPFRRACYRLYASMDNYLWPVRPLHFLAGVTSIGVLQMRISPVPLFPFLPVFINRFSEWTKLFIVSIMTAYIPVFLLRQLLSRFYFSYKRYLFEDPKKHSLTTKVWNVSHKLLLSISPPLLNSSENLLPSPKVPSLDETVAKYICSIRNIMRKDEYDLIKEQAQSFLENEGRRLQMYAWIMSMTTDNYITPFWETYAYLYRRCPLLVNSSVAHADLLDVPTDRQMTKAFMAAHVTYFECMSQLAVDRQAIKPLGSGLVCSKHYDKLYSTCRIPGETMDKLVNYGISKHIIAMADGCFYKVMLCDKKNRIYNINQLAKIYAEMLSRKETVDGPQGMVAALTVDSRDQWARNRWKFFLQHPVNAATLNEIESAAFILVFDDSDYSYDPENPDKISHFLRNMLTGNGINRWADKSLNYVVSRNGRFGGTIEHSIGDGAEFDHIMENFTANVLLAEIPSLEEQRNIERLAECDRGLELAVRLPIEVSSEMAAEIERSYSEYSKLRDDVDVAATMFREFGKGLIKTFGVSPDAFIQMAIQLANYKDQERFVLTYESASARFYKNSRTETLRTVTNQSCEFVLSMINGKASKQEKIKRLRAACAIHSHKNREAMVGQGIDRHLFVLYMLSQGLLISSPFLDHYISQPWLLSTSHIPNVTNQIDEDDEVWKSWIGACFGAVAPSGYGVCYRFGGNHSIFAHVTSYKSAENTNSARFRKHLTEAFREMAELFTAEA